MIDIFAEEVFSGTVLFNEPMKKHTTLRIGGIADVYAVPKDIIALKHLLLISDSNGIQVTPVGSGSNLLVTDKGIEGVVVSLASFDRIQVIEDADSRVRLFVEAGIPLQRLINLSREEGYKGIEGLAGIPGSVSGAVKGNAGSFGYEAGAVTESVALINSKGDISVVEAKDLDFRYRSSNIPDGSIILSANMSFGKDNAQDVAFRINGFLQVKLKSQPISEHSAGCVFKNPEGVSAGRLIDDAGCKGMRRGDIEVSSLHANFFVNKGNGKASDFLALMEDVKVRVLNLSGIELRTEIRIVGRI